MERQGGCDVGVAYRQVHDNEGTDARGYWYGRKQKLSFSLSITSVFQADIYAIRYVLQTTEARISPYESGREAVFKLFDYYQINFKLAWYYHQMLSKLVEYKKLYTHQETWELHALRVLNSCQEPDSNNHLIHPEPTCYISEGVAKSSTGTRPTGTTGNTG